jgi:hypothetical protein
MTWQAPGTLQVSFMQAMQYGLCACSGSPVRLAIIVAVPVVLIAGVVVAHRAAAP